MNIILPDGSSFTLENGSTGFDLAKALGKKLQKSALIAKINEAPADLSTPLHENDRVELLTFETAEGKSAFWHSSSHIMAEAVQDLFPAAKIAIGPSIDAGFYYDFEVEKPFAPEDIEKIGKRCYDIIAQKKPFARKECSKEETVELFRKRSEPYKIELLQEMQGQPSLYYQGGAWFDLCRGPHVPDTGYIKAIKLTSNAGAYWRGDEKNTMLQRIYGISFPSKPQLDEYLAMIEEAKKRDHRKLGKELELFSFHAEGAGFPFWHPRGMILYNTIYEFCRNEHLARGYSEIKTPIILNEELWHRSGHWEKYRENMYFTEIDEEMHAIKPMNCPGGLLIFKSKSHSYRELPIKNFEFGLVHRHEKSSVLHGLFRVRQFTQDDAHIFCIPEQIEAQVSEVMDFIFHLYKTFGFHDFAIELSTRPQNYIGELEVWNTAESALENVLKTKNIPYKLNPGDGAFYGPKIDFHITDSLKRSWQCGTIQVDFSMPKRFEIDYTDADGQRKTPVMIHRALLGSMERFIGILIEHFGGCLPLWLSPVQARVIPVSEKVLEYAETVYHRLVAAGIRAELDVRNDKIGYKIREAELNKIPYMAIVGEKEKAAESVSLRQHKHGDKGSSGLQQFIDLLKKEIADKAIL